MIDKSSPQQQCFGLALVIVALLASNVCYGLPAGSSAEAEREKLITSVQWDQACTEVISFHCPEAPASSNPSVLWDCVVDHRHDATANDECQAAVLQVETQLSSKKLFVDPNVRD